MKPHKHPLLKLLSAAVVLGITASTASAATFWFDGGTVDINTNGNGASAGAAGTWNTTLKNWDQGNGLAHVVWNNTTNAADTAVFGVVNTRAVTLTGTVVADTVSVTANGWSFTGGTLDVNVLDSNTGGTTSINSNLTGTVQFKSTGSALNLTNSAGFTINSDNSSSGLTSTQLSLANDFNHVIINHSAALGGSSATVNISKGTLNLGNNAVPNNNVPISYNAWATDLAGTIRGRFSESTWNGTINLTGNSQLMTRASAGVKLILSNTATINLNANDLSLWSSGVAAGIELNGAISGTGNLSMGGGLGVLGGADTATGTTTLGAANSFSGTVTTTQNLGTLALNHVDALQNATLDTAASGTQAVTFVVSGSNTYNIGALQGADALNIGSNTISIGSKTASTNYSGAITGSGGLTKVGSASVLELSGNSSTTYTGATTVHAGKLVVNGNISTSATTVKTGATLGGSGTVGALTIETGGTLAPGNSPGILNVSGNYIQSGLLSLELNGTTAGSGYDQVNVTGSVTLSGALSATVGYTPVNGNLLFILLNDGTDAISGTFTGLAQGSTVTYSGSDWQISYTADSGTNSFTGGNDIALKAIPEPGAALLGGLGLLALLRRRR